MVSRVYPKIISDSPVNKGREAQFQFDAYADILARTILSKGTPIPLTIGIYGGWGTGKTSLLQILKAKLDEYTQLALATTEGAADDVRPCKSVWFNAWKYTGEEEIYVSLLDQLRRAMSQDKQLMEQISDRIKTFGRKYNWPEAIISVMTQFVTGGRLSLELAQHREGSPFRQGLLLYDEFQTLFDELINDFTHKHKDGVLVVLIDDLDRCLPSKIVQMLETIRRFLDTSNSVFVLAADPNIILAGVRAHYASSGIEGINPREYMEKIIQVRFSLPPLRVEDFTAFVEKLPGIEPPTDKFLKLLVNGIRTNPRKIKTFVNHLELEWSILINTGLSRLLPKENLIEWLVLNEACPTLNDEIRSIDGDINKQSFIVKLRQFAGSTSEEREIMVKGDERLGIFTEEKLLLELLTLGTFDFSTMAIGLCVHLSPPPFLLAMEDVKDRIDSVLRELTDHERRIIELVYGLRGGEPLSIAQVGSEFNLSSVTIRRHLDKALRKLRHPSRSRKLQMMVKSGQSLSTEQAMLIDAIFGIRI